MEYWKDSIEPCIHTYYLVLAKEVLLPHRFG